MMIVHNNQHGSDAEVYNAHRYQESRQSTVFGSLKYVQRLPIVSRQRLVRIHVETVSILILRQSVNFRYA